MMASATYPERWSILNDRNTVIMLMLVIFTAITAYVEIMNNWGDLANYYRNTEEILSGKMPYSEAVFEYPPLSLIFMMVPRLLSWDVTSFHYMFTAQSLIFILIGAAVIYKISDEFIGDRGRGGLILLCLLIFGTHFLIARNDIYPAVIALIGIWLYLKKKFIPAFVIVSLAAMTKLYPAIFLIAMVIPFLIEKKWKTAITVTAVSLLVCLIVELPFLITDPSTAFAYLSYHSDRGIQIESVASGFIMLCELIVPTDVTWVFSYGSDNIVGTIPDMLAPLMNPLLAVSLIVFVGVMFIRIMKSEEARKNVLPIAALMSLTMILLFIVFSKVYSAQYYIWIVGILIFSQLNCFDRAHRDEILKLLIPFGIFTFLSYTGYVIFDVRTFNAVAVILVVLKNVFTILLTWELIHLCLCETSETKCENTQGAFASLRDSLKHVTGKS
jgi:hypothetical protein